MAERKFIVLATSGVSSSMWDDALESEETARFNNDGSKVFLSHREDTTPESFGGYEENTLSQMLGTILAQDEWMQDQTDEGIPL